MGRGTSKAGKGAKGGGSAKQAQEEPKGRNGSINQLMQDMQQNTPQAGKAQSAESIRQYGFESIDELRDYAENRFITQDAPDAGRLKRAIQIRPLFSDTAILDNANAGVNRDLADWLKTRLDVSVEQYGRNSYLVNMKLRADGSKKRKRPKSAK